MAQDPKTIVHTSNMLWGDQVGIIDALDAMDLVGAGETGLDALREKRQPVIYPFNRNGNRKGFVAPLNPYV
jgi:hypothetical protein